MIALIDYDAGNIKSVEKALILLGEEVVVTRDRDTLLSADKVVLPGVGAFGDAMENLRKYGLVEVIHEIVAKKTPFLGIFISKSTQNGLIFPIFSRFWLFFVSDKLNFQRAQGVRKVSNSVKNEGDNALKSHFNRLKLKVPLDFCVFM